MIAIACDHGGFVLKEKIVAHLKEKGIECKDFGAMSEERVDYPLYAQRACRSVISGECEKGLLICTTGLGMSIAANKLRGIRAVCCSDAFSTRFSRLHNNANVLTMGQAVIGEGVAKELVDIFLSTEFMGGRHAQRVDMLEE
ncbi:MAG: ribose 5-phosphate isomerase B [Eubacteriales bacterium]